MILDELSPFEKLALLPAKEREKIVAGLSNEEAAAFFSDWDLIGRPKQQPPKWNWLVWLLLAGRGFGKTRTGAEMVKRWKEDFPVIHLVGPTSADARDVMVEGPAGIRSICPEAIYESSRRRVVFRNGSIALMFSADEPDRLRGPQCYKAWADEPASWRYPEAWDQMMFGLRLGSLPQVVATTTPRPTPLIKDLVARKDRDVALTIGSTRENLTNLAPTFLNTVVAKYKDTRLGRQELEAELLTDTEGALWTNALIERYRVTQAFPMEVIVVGVDPPAADPEMNMAGEEEKRLNAECGIITAGRYQQRHAEGRGLPHVNVLADDSMTGSPEQWGRAVVDTYWREGAHIVVAESNQGRAMVRSVIQNIDPNVPVKLVWASQNKRTRAEPISAAYEQGRCHHLGFFADLETQMCNWVPGEKSPDRMDALVWALWALLIGGPRRVGRLASGN